MHISRASAELPNQQHPLRGKPRIPLRWTINAKRDRTLDPALMLLGEWISRGPISMFQVRWTSIGETLGHPTGENFCDSRWIGASSFQVPSGLIVFQHKTQM